MLLVIVFMCTSGTGMLSGWSSLKLSKMSAKKVAISINVVYNDDIYSQESLIYSGETTLLPCKLSKLCQFYVWISLCLIHVQLICPALSLNQW